MQYYEMVQFGVMGAGILATLGIVCVSIYFERLVSKKNAELDKAEAETQKLMTMLTNTKLRVYYANITHAELKAWAGRQTRLSKGSREDLEHLLKAQSEQFLEIQEHTKYPNVLGGDSA